MSYSSLEEAMLYGTGIERSFRCHVHGDTNPSASVNSMSGLWFCYACGARGKYNVAELPPDKAATSIIKYIDALAELPRTYTESWLGIYDASGPGDYWLSRFTEEYCRKYRLGQDPAARFATIPVRDELGEVLGVIRRDLTGLDTAKYRYPPGVTMSRLLFNHDRCTGDVLMVTEGATDAIALDEAGWTDVMATYRNGVSRKQVQMLREYAPEVVLVAYDMDEAGDLGYRQLKHALGSFARVDRLWWDSSTGYKDLASVPLDERATLVEKLTRDYP